MFSIWKVIMQVYFVCVFKQPDFKLKRAAENHFRLSFMVERCINSKELGFEDSWHFYCTL